MIRRFEDLEEGAVFEASIPWYGGDVQHLFIKVIKDTGDEAAPSVGVNPDGSVVFDRTLADWFGPEQHVFPRSSG